MLDVHPPHAPTHTWRDFFIHVGTICVGLLIAIGLEQLVEAIHHANERRELIVELREEAAANLKTLHQDSNVLLAESEWDLAAIVALEHASSKQGIVQVQLPDHKPFGHNTQPNRSVWTLSIGNGKAALLPESRAQSYELMDRAAAQALTATEARNMTLTAMRSVELRLHAQLIPGASLSLPASEVPVVLEKLASRAAALQYEVERDAILAGYCDAVDQETLDQRQVGYMIAKQANAAQERINRIR